MPEIMRSVLRQARSFPHAIPPFLRITGRFRLEGVPLDNNVVERALKRAIVHRKNSLFYKTLNGAKAGDLFMSLIYTAEVNGVNPFEYLTALLRHPLELPERPSEWMPWNFHSSLVRLQAGPDPPA